MKHNQNYLSILIWVAVYAIAMGFLESAVVVYLRQIYYPEGFGFPLKMMDKTIALTEFFRELATVIMLLSIGFIVSRKNIERFAIFIFVFGIWDIFYYVFLELLLGWPASFFTWDLLFLIPTLWIGPVLAPVINSFTMIALGSMIFKFGASGKDALLNRKEWILLIAGSLVVFVSYILDYCRFMLTEFSIIDLFFKSNSGLILQKASAYTPLFFNWWIFTVGEMILLSALFIYIFRMKKSET